MSRRSTRTVWTSLTRPFKTILVAGAAVTLYGLATWILGVQQHVTSDAASVTLRGTPIPYLSATATASGILALGTAALAYAAYKQAIAAERQIQALKDQATISEKSRLASVRPTLAIRLTQRPETLDAERVEETLAHSPFFMTAPGGQNLSFAIRNLGRGSATKVWTWVQVWGVAAKAPLAWTTQEGSFALRTDDSPSFQLPVMDESLGPDQELPFETLVWLEGPRQSNGGFALGYLAQQIVINAKCRDIDGVEQPIMRRGYRLRAIVPRPAIRPPTPSEGLARLGGQVVPGYTLLWEKIPERELERIPIASLPQEWDSRSPN